MANINTLQKGLIAHYPLDGVSETKDITPYANHGTNNGATLSTGRKGEANGSYSFDGVNDRIYSNDMLNGGQEATLSAWIKPDYISGTRFIIGIEGAYKIDVRSTFTSTIRTSGNVWSTYSSGVALTTNEWIYVVSTYNGSELKMYINGVICPNIISISGDIYNSAANFFIGSLNGAADYFDGSIQDVRIYNRALEEDEIKLLYDSFKPEIATTDLNKGLVGHWKMDGGSEGTEGTENVTIDPLFNSSNIPNNTSSGAFGSWVFSSWVGDNHELVNSDLTNGKALKITGTSTIGANDFWNTGWRDNVPINTEHTVSFYAKGVGTIEIRSHWGPLLTINLTDTLTKYEITTTKSSTSSQYLYIATANLLGGEYLHFELPQVELKDHTTPFVDGTREDLAKDSTPYQNHGVINGATLTTGRNGESNGAYSFDGVDDYVDLGDDNIFNSLPISLSLWFYQDGIRRGDLINKYYASSVNGYSIGLATDGGIRLYFFKTASDYISDYNAYHGQPILNSWNHVFIKVDNNNAKIYLNGDLIATKLWVGTSGVPTTTENLSLGYYPGSTSVYSNNIISDVRIYDRALSDNEIKLLYDSYKPKGTSIGSLQKGLVLDMPLTTKHMKSATVVSDRTPYGNNGTVNGATVGSQYTSFDGVDDYIGGGPLLNQNSNEFSVAAWINTSEDEVFPGENLIFGFNNEFPGVSYAGFSIRLRDDVPAIACRKADNSSYYDTYLGDKIIDGNWHLIVGTFKNGDKLRKYVDGIQIQTADVTQGYLVTTANTRIGGNTFSGKYYDGLMSGVKVWNRQLSAEEVKLLYDSTLKPSITEETLNEGKVLDLPLTTVYTSGTTAIDKSGEGNNGTISGATTGATETTFDGDDVIVTGLNVAGFSQLTASLWFYPTVSSVGTKTIMGTWTSNTDMAFDIDYKAANTISINIKTETGDRVDINSSTVLPISSWYHIITVWDNTNCKIYINGVYDTQGAVSGTTLEETVTEEVVIGAYKNSTSAQNAIGHISNAKIWNRALSEEEIATLYSKGRN